MSETQNWRNWSLEIPPTEGAYKTNSGWVIKQPNGTEEVLVALSANNFVASSNADISSVKFPRAKVYTVGQNMDFVVNFNEPVDIVNTPRLTLTLTSGSVFANYLSGTGTNKITFRYTVQASDIDLDGVALGSNVDLNTTGTVKDAGTATNATVTFAGSTNTSVTVDALVRSIFSVTSPSGNRTTGQNVDVSVLYNSVVLVNTTGGVPSINMFANNGTTPLVGVKADYVSGSGSNTLVFRYVVQTSDVQASAIKSGANITLNGGLITDTSKTVNAPITFAQATLTGVTLN